MSDNTNNGNLWEVSFTIPSDPRMLKIVRAGIGHLCTIMEFPNVDKNSVVLAVDEACSNIIKHAYDNDNEQTILISCAMFDNRLEVRLRDFGKKSNLEEIQPRNLDDIRPGGLGVHLIRTVMDTVVYENDEEQGNHLLMVKKKKTSRTEGK